jgi:hypothetical protein
VNSSAVTRRILVAIAILIGLIGWETVRLRGRHTNLKELAESVETSKSTAIECFGAQPKPIKTANISAFKDVTDEWGLDFQHAAGPLGTYFMPESVGTGGAFFDYDGDGRLDIYLVQSNRSPDSVGDFPSGTHLESRLFRQTEDGKLVDMTHSSGLAGEGYGVGCAAGDVDNDGDVDLYVTRYGQDSLYSNNGNGTFSDVTETAGIRENAWGTCAAFFDYNRDGWLDLIVVNYTVDEKYGHSVACGFRKGLVSYCGPHKFQPTIDRLYRNDGLQVDSAGKSAIQFTDVTEIAGLDKADTFGVGVVCADFNRDGWPDIFVANDGAANRLWINQRDGVFHEEAVQRGCATNARGGVEAGMGIAIGDVNRDRRLDLIVTHLSGEKATLYVDVGDGYFEDVSAKTGMVTPTAQHTGWGAGLIDLNHDGELDFAMVNGLVIPCHSRFPPHGEDEFQIRRDTIENADVFWRDYADQNVLLMGKGQGKFTNATDHGGDFCSAVGSGRSLIHGDLDNDGDVDVLVTNCGGKARLYRNDFSKSGDWLTVRAIDPQLRRDAHGAEIIVRCKSSAFRGTVNPASSFLASNDVRVHFGLGHCERYDEIVVTWPDGPIETATETFEGGATNRSITIQRGMGR